MPGDGGDLAHGGSFVRVLGDYGFRRERRPPQEFDLAGDAPQVLHQHQDVAFEFQVALELAAQMPWYIGSGTGTPKFCQVSALALNANW